MSEFKLGPNGSLIYAIEFLESNLEWLINKIESFDKKTDDDVTLGPYFIFDFPGQVELYTNHDSM